jgi:hypothetical protein
LGIILEGEHHLFKQFHHSECQSHRHPALPW